jgi:phospholipid/cholesterol/gamma-HCH transport system substrate-binding protein
MRRPVHPRTARTFVVGLAATAAIGLILYYSMIANSLGGLPGSSHTYVKAAFADVGTLAVNDEVRDSSVRVGQVSAVAFENGHAVVTLQLDGDRPVYRDARAAVWDQSPLAVKFVELNPGTPAAGPLGDAVVPQEQTRGSQSLDQLLDVFDPATRDALGSTARELGSGVGGQGQHLNDFLRTSPQLLTDLERISVAASSPQADLTGLLQTTDRLAGRFAGRQNEISQLLGQTDQTLRAVNVDGGRPLADSLHQLPHALDQAEQAMTRLNQPLADTDSALTTLQPGADALGRSAGDLRGFLREAVPPVRKIPGVSATAAPAADALATTFADARPLVPPLNQALANALLPLRYLAPYAPEITALFGQKSALAGHVGDQHYLRLGAALPYPQAQAVLGGLVPTLPRDPYPAPGQSRQDSASPLLPQGGSR